MHVPLYRFSSTLKCHFDRRKHQEYHVGSSYCHVLQCKEFKSLVLKFSLYRCRRLVAI